MSKDSLKIIAFTNGTASHRWRLTSIAERVNKNSPHQMLVVPYQAWKEDTMGADIIILEMLTAPKMVEFCQKQGAKVIFEVDDAFIDTYTRDERKNLQHMGDGWRENAIKTVGMCDALTVTNYYLAENMAKHTDKPIHILPNYIDLNWYGSEDLNIVRNTNEVRIGWFGSKGHYEDLRMIVHALKRVLDKYPEAKFVYSGFGGMSSDRLVTEVGWGEDVFKELPRNRREFVIAVHEDLWPMKHRVLDFDIGIAPLIDDPFNHCKTPIKWMEYSLLDTATVVSPTVYGEHPIKKDYSIVEHGKTGFIADTEDEWVEYLSKLIESKKLRTSMAKKAKQKVLKKWNIDNHWQKWVEVYQSVVDSE